MCTRVYIHTYVCMYLRNHFSSINSSPRISENQQHKSQHNQLRAAAQPVRPAAPRGSTTSEPCSTSSWQHNQ